MNEQINESMNEQTNEEWLNDDSELKGVKLYNCFKPKRNNSQ